MCSRARLRYQDRLCTFSYIHIYKYIFFIFQVLSPSLVPRPAGAQCSVLMSLRGYRFIDMSVAERAATTAAADGPPPPTGRDARRETTRGCRTSSATRGRPARSRWSPRWPAGRHTALHRDRDPGGGGTSHTHQEQRGQEQAGHVVRLLGGGRQHRVEGGGRGQRAGRREHGPRTLLHIGAARRRRRAARHHRLAPAPPLAAAARQRLEAHACCYKGSPGRARDRARRYRERGGAGVVGARGVGVAERALFEEAVVVAVVEPGGGGRAERRRRRRRLRPAPAEEPCKERGSEYFIHTLDIERLTLRSVTHLQRP